MSEMNLLNSKERERLERLTRRIEFLRERSTRDDGSDHWHDRAELSALVWVTEGFVALKAGTYQEPPVEQRVRKNQLTALERWERRNGMEVGTRP